MDRARPQLNVVADANALATSAVERILARLEQVRDRVAVCLSGGSTVQRLYEVIATEPYLGRVPWNRVHWFWGDERFVPLSDPRSNAGMAHRLLFDRVPCPQGNIHPIPTSCRNVQEAAHLYEADLRLFYGAGHLDPARPLFAVALMGLGADGHTASLFPGRAELEENERWVVGVEDAGLDPFVPRVTLTYPALASSGEMLFLVCGSEKRNALARVVAGESLPATRAYSHGDLIWLVDRDAAPEDYHVV